MTESNGGLGGFPAGMFIGGEWLDSASDGAEIEVLDPATGAPIATVPSGSIDDANASVEAASAAGAAWADTPPRIRAETLRRIFELITERSDELAKLIVAEMGKALPEAAGEVTYAAEFFRWFSEETVRNIGSISTAPSGDKRIIVEHQPVGVSLLITPWNFPAAMATRKIAPALAAGCTVIVKPASETPLTALALAELYTEAGVPPGVINILPSARSGEVVPAMLADSRVRKLSFTGSTEVGTILLAEAAKHVVNASMELGGNAPFLIFEDADMDEAIEGAMIAKMRNGGQSCIAANRFYAHASIADEFSAQLSKAMQSMIVGSGLEPNVGLGPLINLRAQQNMEDLVDVSVSAGATVGTGGRAPDRRGFFWEPTVLADVTPGSPILDVEIFGPIAPIVAFDSEEEAVVMANDTVHGLAAYVYTRDLGRAMRVSEALESGMVGVNRGLMSDPAAPFGGMKESGIGREGAHVGMLEFTETKYIAIDW